MHSNPTPKILHVAFCDKFIPPFIEFLRGSFPLGQHEFLLLSAMADDAIKEKQYSNVFVASQTLLSHIHYVAKVIVQMHRADKIISHSLQNTNLVILFFMPWLLKKCYWVMWGGDLYAYQLGERTIKRKLKEFLRRTVFKRIGHLVTFIKGDFELAQQWYGTKAQFQECFMYPSNLYQDYLYQNDPSQNDLHQNDNFEPKPSDETNVLVGNSADTSNNHLGAFEKLDALKGHNIQVYVPLSYGGSEAYQRSVIADGKKRFGDNFHPLTEMLPFDEYLDLLARIDIAMFNHERQQAMGNTISLLGLGKKVFMRSGMTHWRFFQDKGIRVFDITDFNLSIFEPVDREHNQQVIKQYFSKENYLQQLRELFS